MSSLRRPTLRRPQDDRGIAVTSEYVLLLGVSMLIFMAIYIGFSSFGNTAAADARSAAAYRVAAQVSGRLTAAAQGDAAVSESIEIPGRICGSPYVIYPSRDGKAICVLVDGEEQEVPVLAPASTRIDGFMVSLPAGHRIDYDPYARRLALA